LRASPSRSDIEFFGLAHSQALVVLYQIYFALDLGALKSVMVMFTSSGSDRRSDTLLGF